MKNNRRNFLKLTSLVGLSVASGDIMKGFASEPQNKNSVETYSGEKHNQIFNEYSGL